MPESTRIMAACDFAVVGGGIAGMTAAVRAAERGLRACVLEQGADERYPCNTRYSGGIFHTAFFDPYRPVDELRGLVAKAAGPQADAELIETLVVEARRLLDWLRGHDVRFMRVGPLKAHRWCIAPPKPIAPGLEWRGRGPDAMLRTLAARLRGLGGRLELAARATALARRDDDWDVSVALRNGDALLRARAVVIADRGFQADVTMLRRHIAPLPERILQRGAANGRGDWLRMAAEAGAVIAGLDAFYGHLQSRDALADPSVWPYPELDAVAAAAVVVDAAGRRFCDEGLGGVSVANALARLPDPASATLVCDAAIWDGPGRAARSPANPFLERYGGTVHRAGTLQALASRIGTDPALLADTVAGYNRALAQQALPSLDPSRT